MADRFTDTGRRTVLITGATAGIGYEAARVLAEGGAQVVITGRDADRGERAAAAIRGASGNERVKFLQADHSTVGGNEELATHISEALPGLDVLVNNVGGNYATRWDTADGYEATLAMNLVGPFALTSELLPLLQANAPSRLINVGSAAFQMWKRDPFEDVQSREQFVGAEAYAQTKLLNLLFTLALARRLAPEQVTANTLHPGLSWTEMTQSMTPETMPFPKALWPFLRLLQRLGSPANAGRRVAFLAASPEVGAYTGEYFVGKLRPKRLSARELDQENQERAWRLAAELVAGAATSRRRRQRRTGAGERLMRVAYFYFMKPEPERIRTVAPRHASYWQGLALRDYRGGPFADRSGGLILFDSDSAQEAEQLVSRDPFVHERLLEHRWVKAWDAGAAGADDGGGARKERAEP